MSKPDDIPSGAVTAHVPASAVAFAIEKPEPEISSSDRFSFTAFLAVALHAAVILGIGFTLPDPPRPLHHLEVTLTRFSSEEAPEQADFLAQSNQQSSGSLAEARELLTDREAPFADTQITDALQPRPEGGAPASGSSLSTTAASRDQVARTDSISPAAEQTPNAASLMAQAVELASLNARYSSEIQIDARGRRVRRLTSVSARSAVEASYLEAWRNKVERIGNLNYPAEARRRGLEGDLRVLVEIEASGRMISVHILDSSGSEVLDASALRIVRLAAPFPPFPDKLRAEADVLQIVRTWQFRRRGFGPG